jgi:Pentapeptide repeats (8 copies)
MMGANLRGADLTLATLNGADCTDADFRQSMWSKTSFARVIGLSRARGLLEVSRGDASSIDWWTLREAIDVLPDFLLDHLGVPAALRPNSAVAPAPR